jgi:Family of unknown function (DUF5995)
LVQLRKNPEQGLDYNSREAESKHLSWGGIYRMPDQDLVIDRMQAIIDAWEAASDRRAIFLECYALMTRNMLAAISQGEFEDNIWVSTLLQHFADYYFEALQAYDATPEKAPLVWRYAFDAARRSNIHVLRNLVLGVNAHINFDLVFALSDALQSEWAVLTPEKRQSRYRDHCLVNKIITDTIDSVQDQIVDRYDAMMEVVDKVLGPLDEWMTAWMIRDWREQVWSHATQLVEALDEADRQALIEAVEKHSLQRAHAILGEEGLAGLKDLV